MAWLRNAWFIFICERNTGRESGHLALLLRRLDARQICVHQYPHADYGWWTTNEYKVGYHTSARARLAEGAVVFMQDFVATNPFAPSSKSNDELGVESREEFCRQLMSTREIQTQPLSAMARVTTTISGKTNERGEIIKGSNDDMAFTFSMCCYFISMLHEHGIPSVDDALLNRD